MKGLLNAMPKDKSKFFLTSMPRLVFLQRLQLLGLDKLVTETAETGAGERFERLRKSAPGEGAGLPGPELTLS